MQINYFSPIRLTLALLPELIERGGPDREHLVGRGPALAAGRGGVRRDEGRAHGVVGVDAGRPPRHRRRDPRREPRRDRHRAVPPPRQRPARPRPASRCSRSTRWSSRCSARSSTGTFEVYVPDWFNGVYEGKYKDVDSLPRTAPSPSSAPNSAARTGVDFVGREGPEVDAGSVLGVRRGGRWSWSRGIPRSRRRRARGPGRSPCSRRTVSRGRTTGRR